MNKDNKKEAINVLAELARDLIVNGVLLRNVVRFFVNNGFPIKMSQQITRIGEIRANEFLAFKSE